MNWEEWCRRYPAKVVDKAPTDFEAFLNRRLKRSHIKITAK